MIWAVRDPIIGFETEGKGVSKRRVEVEIDPGVRDKRLYVIEPEFAGALTVMGRQGNILSRVIRDGWDRGNLATLTKNSPARATGAHISITGHITADELRATLDRVSIANGFGNRFLWALVKRARVLPFGGVLDEETAVDLGRRTRTAIEAARRVECVTMTADARAAWRKVYPALSEGRPGLLGEITARAEAQTIRLALAYALLDGRPEVDATHLQAALAVRGYAYASAAYIWGDAIGDPVADEILSILRAAEAAGKTRTEIRDIFGRHRSADEIGGALTRLATAGKATCTMRSETGGRPAEVWIATAEAG